MKIERKNPSFDRELRRSLRSIDRKTEDWKERDIRSRTSDVPTDGSASRHAYKSHKTRYRKTILVFIAGDGRFSKADRSSGEKERTSSENDKPVCLTI